MRLEALLQLRIACRLDHLGQRFHDLVLGVIDVLQGVQEEIIHRFDIFAKESMVVPMWVATGAERRPFSLGDIWLNRTDYCRFQRVGPSGLLALP